MAGTLAFDVKDKLFDSLNTDPNFLPLYQIDGIWYGYEGEIGSRPRELIWIGEIVWEDERAVGLGNARRDEWFTIMITIEAHTEGDTQKEANDRVKGWMQKLETMVRNPRWSGLPLTASEIKPQMLGEGADVGGRGAILVLSLLVQARKT